MAERHSRHPDIPCQRPPPHFALVESPERRLRRVTTARLVTSPGDSYAREMLDALADATSFVLVTGFASVAGVEVIEQAVRRVLERGGQGRIVIAVDRQGFNAASVFQALLDLRSGHGARLSIGVVLEGSGLLHAKALFTQGPRGDRLLVGSANLTRTALGTNHELGVLLADAQQDVRRAFLQFVTSIAPRSLDGPDAQGFLISRGLLSAPPPGHARKAPTAGLDLSSALDRLKRLEALEIPAEEHLASWIHRGYLVGRGRRSLDALVLRLPQERLIKSGFIRAPKREVLGLASHETRSMGYGVDLIPTADAETLRRDARRVSLLLAKLTLNLPCFGLWMPESYWEVFVAAREALQSAHSLAPGRVHDLADRHRSYLYGGGLEEEVDRILARLGELEILVPGKRDALRAFLLPRFQRELELRSPDVLAACVEFRTARQRWSPFDQTETPYRQLMVDVVQATFAATYRTGDWPRRFRSHAARTVAEAIERLLTRAGGAADDDTATAILDRASTWEAPERPMADVVAEFRGLVDDELVFPPPALAELTTTSGADEGVAADSEAAADDSVE
jgi:HKD family nuclease